MPIVPKNRSAFPAEPICRPDVTARARLRPPLGLSSPVAAPAPASVPAPETIQSGRSSPREFDVGYGKPPRHARFKPGQSGNPKGRPKGAKGMKTLVRQLLTEKLTVKTAAGPKRMSRMEAALHKLAERAFAGELRALHWLVQLYQAAVPDEPARDQVVSPAPADMDAHDQALLDALKDILIGGKSGS